MLVSLQFTGDQQGSHRKIDPSETKRYASLVDEDMVLRKKHMETKSEIPCRVSSDVHEWYNDWRTVSGICSVKIQYR